MLVLALVLAAASLNIRQQVDAFDSDFSVSMRRRVVEVLTGFVSFVHAAEDEDRAASVRNHHVRHLRRLNVDQQRLASRRLVENFRQLVSDDLTRAVGLKKILMMVDGDDRQVRAVNFRNLLNLDDIRVRFNRLVVDLRIVVHLLMILEVIKVVVDLLARRMVVMVVNVMLSVRLGVSERMLIVIRFRRFLVAEIYVLISDRNVVGLLMLQLVLLLLRLLLDLLLLLVLLLL